MFDSAERPLPAAEALSRLFWLTPAEARVVAGLTAGKSLREVAHALGIAFETARTHLARARAKTDSASQTDLVRQAVQTLSAVRQL